MSVKLSVPQSSPKDGYLAHKAEIDDAIVRVLTSGNYILGEETSMFEDEFARYVGVRFGIGVGSGTEALHIALRACEVGPEDEVITVSFTAVATVAAIEMCGARPVLVDIDPRTFTIDPERIEQAVTSRTKVIIPVHIYGHPSNMEDILSIARRHRLRIVEDCAQAHGAMVQGRKVGSWGDIAAFSFYPTKNLGAFGDGGMVVTDNPDLSRLAKLLRQYGWRERYVSDVPGWNTRLDELQAAILRVKLRFLDEDNVKRRERAQSYNNLLTRTKLRLPEEMSYVKHCYHLYVIRSSRRNELQLYLKSLGIRSIVHYPMPVHLQPAYYNRLQTVGRLIESERAAKEVLSLPMYPELSLEKLNIVADAIIAFEQGVERL